MAKEISDSSFLCLCVREVLDFLIGDFNLPTTIEEDTAVFDLSHKNYHDEPFNLPYLKGAEIDNLFIQFGLETPVCYEFGSSRWARMQTLITELDKVKKASQLISYLFSKKHFHSKLNKFNSIEEFETYYSAVCNKGVDYINKQLYLSGKLLIITEYICRIQDRNCNLQITSKQIQNVNSEYISSLSDRIRIDIENQNYDSVITKCRTLIEEVLMFIIAEHNEKPSEKGNINTLSQQCKALLKMKCCHEYDKRINDLLGGLEKIVNSITNLRNINSDAHGAGKNRIEIKEREAFLISNATQTYCDYLLSVHNSQQR